MLNPRHDGAVARLTNHVPHRLPAGWTTRVRCAATVGASVPEPDCAIVRGNSTTYDTRLPTPDDFGIMIEVADQSLFFDREKKGSMYARAAIPVYWIVNIPDGQVEVYTDPHPSDSLPVYRTRTDYRPGDDIPIALDGATAATIHAADLLP